MAYVAARGCLKRLPLDKISSQILVCIWAGRAGGKRQGTERKLWGREKEGKENVRRGDRGDFISTLAFSIYFVLVARHNYA